MTCAPASIGRTCWVREVVVWASVMRTNERSSRAGQESLTDILLCEIAADEDDLRLALFLGLPLALRLAVEHHVHALEHEAVGVALHRHDALAAQDVGTLLLGDAVDPRHELHRIDVALEPDRHRPHILVVIVLESMMMMAVGVNVPMIAILGRQEIRLDLE